MNTTTVEFSGQEFQVKRPTTHTVCRTKYPKVYSGRYFVSDSNVPWSVDYPHYLNNRVNNTLTANVRKALENGLSHGSDPRDLDPDKPIRSYYELQYDENGYPLNPVGRTGSGPDHGDLWFFGANFAADPLITWLDTDKNVLKMLAITRGDGGGIALPGGMADKGEAAGSTLNRELGEETNVKNLRMEDGKLVYAGYVDDWRNVDHSWMETIVVHRHIERELAESLPVAAGDDAADAYWLELTSKAVLDNMFASHGQFVELALKKLRTEDSAAADASARAMAA